MIGNPQIEIDRIGAQNGCEARCGKGAGIRVAIGHHIHHRAVGCPPADIAGAFIEVAVNDFDGIACQIGKAVAPVFERHILPCRADAGRILGDAGMERCRKRGDLSGNRPHFLGNHGKALASLAGTGRFKPRVHRDDTGMEHDLIEFGDFALGLFGHFQSNGQNIVVHQGALGVRRFGARA